MSKKVPERWLDYRTCSKIKNTRFVACKLPLPEEKWRLDPDVRFRPEDLMSKFPNIKCVIDLTFANNYYNGINEFFSKGVRYVKLKCPPRKPLPESIYERTSVGIARRSSQQVSWQINFKSEVNSFLTEHPNEDELICVHCTHGVNRTGYLICRYMIQELGFSSTEALKVFTDSRGHAIERPVYINALMKLECKKQSMTSS